MKLEFSLSENISEKLIALKRESANGGDMTFNEFAAELLAREVRRLYPERVRYDENSGEIIPRKK